MLTFFFQYGSRLFARNNLPQWPPSPAWALTMMPYIRLCYTSLYYETFGLLERDLNRALRGRLPNDDRPAPAVAPAAQGGEQNANQNPANQEEEVGIWTALFRLGGDFLGLLDAADGDEDELAVDGVPREDGGREGGELRLQLELVVGEDEDDDEADEQQDVAREPDQFGAAQDDAAPARQIQDRRRGAERQQEQPAPAAQINNNNNAEDVPTGTILTSVINATVTQLLLPVIAAGMGEVLRIALPKPWVTRPPLSPPTGLLQQRWGRSLVGGCIFLVARDALSLYTKYRRVEMRKHRKVRNVERRANHRGG